MKKNYKSIGMVVLLFSVVLLSGCVSITSYSVDTNNTIKFVGTWRGNAFSPNDNQGNTISVNGQPITITFFPNGTYWTAKRLLHRWDLKENPRILAPTQNIIILYPNNASIPFLYKLSNNDMKLYLYGPNGVMWLTKEV